MLLSARSFALRALGSLAVVCAALPERAAVAQEQARVPPRPLDHPDAPYPASELFERREANVILDITIERDGTVSNAQVHQSGGEAFDQAALKAVRTWTFTPGLRGGKPARFRVQAQFHFDPPPVPAAPAAPPSQAKPSAPPPKGQAPPKPEQPVAAEKVVEVEVQGHKERDTGAAGEYHAPIAQLGYVPTQNASGRLTLAPGIYLSNEGGEGHAEQVFLRGFDTHEGQEVEFTVDGVPINDAGNPHGTGYADTHFIIPELIDSLRVLESPFDPAQGNFAVAGSADFHLGLEQRGLTTKLSYGMFNTERLLMLWGPNGTSDGTFAGAEVYNTSGYGVSRAARHATGIAQYEGRFSEHGSWRVTGTAYGTDFQSAGPIRYDDYHAGRVDFYGTEDPRQGGLASRFSLAAALHDAIGATDFDVQLFYVRRTMRLLEDFTGFIEDSQSPLQNLHAQRGDLSDIAFDGHTVGLRSTARYTGKLFGLTQSLELGLSARGDFVNGRQDRILSASSEDLAPYKTNHDLSSALGDFALYADAGLHLLPWLSLRGGLRAELFEFDVTNNCAVQGGIDHPSPQAQPDASCLTENTSDGSYREPQQRNTTGAALVMPRGTLVIGPFAGFSLSMSAGRGVRSIDPAYVSQGFVTPFISLTAYEGGISYARLLDNGVSVTAKSVFFTTHVGQDLAFDPNEVTYALTSGATRTGWSGSGRVTGSFFDLAGNVTFVRGTYDGTAGADLAGAQTLGLGTSIANQAGLLIPYVPSIVVRSDDALFHDLGFSALGRPFRGILAVGVSGIGPRPLPFDQKSDAIFLLDASAAVAWRPLELGVTMTNATGAKYAAGEYNYVSYFPHPGGPALPTLVPARAFTAGAPRIVLVSLSGNIGGS